MPHHLPARSTGQIVHPIEDRLLTEIEAAQLRSQSVRTLQAERLRGGGCPYVKIGRSVRYRYSDVLRFIDSHLVRSTTEADARHTSAAEGLEPATT
jgi:hypothetical protein